MFCIVPNPKERQMFQNVIARLRTFLTKLMMSRDEKEMLAKDRRKEALKAQFPEELEKYREFGLSWAAKGIVFLRFPTFEEYLLGRELELREPVKNMLADYGLPFWPIPRT